MTTYCEDCDNVELTSRSKHPSQWLCAATKVLNDDYVQKEIRCFPPFKKCYQVNDGKCDKFKPLRKETNNVK